MDKVMSVEERIRRAEDIYNRRNGIYSGVEVNKNQNKLKKKNIKKLLLQVFVCLFIYIVFYTVTNREHIFSEEFRNEVDVFFTEKTKISEIYGNIKRYLQNKFLEDNKENNGTIEVPDELEKNSEEKVQDTEQKNDINSDEKKEEISDENIGGAKETQEKSNLKEELSEQELMEREAKEIKKKISFILPIKGRISSTFGWRNPSTASVPKYHTGLDIAASEGTIIKSATDGKIIMVSSQGDYGNHYQVQIEDVVLVYAHCKKLYLKNGEIVKQGQEIAEVGSTGNSTGAHLHFEIRKGDRKIDPQLILDI